MECFYLELKEENQELKTIMSFCEDGEKPNVVFQKVQEKFGDNRVDGKPEQQPFLYVKVVPVMPKGSRMAASIISTACFEIGVKEEMLKYIRKIK